MIERLDIKLYDEIKKYCDNNGYDFVFFDRDVEDVFIGKSVSSKEKVKEVADFKTKQLINNVDEKNLKTETHRKHCSNILNVLDKYWKRK